MEFRRDCLESVTAIRKENLTAATSTGFIEQEHCCIGINCLNPNSQNRLCNIVLYYKERLFFLQ